MTARFVDCDMMMRYHWGLAIGHTYTHSDGQDNHVAMQGCPSSGTNSASFCNDDESDPDSPEVGNEPDPAITNAEYSLESQDDLDWDESDSEEAEDSEIDEEMYSSTDEMSVQVGCLLLNSTHRMLFCRY
jgi:hypothetical protein